VMMVAPLSLFIKITELFKSALNPVGHHMWNSSNSG
jgi:hypothetical protein